MSSAPSISGQGQFDIPEVQEKKDEVARYYIDREGYGWRDRLAMMWRFDEWGHGSPELSNVLTTTQMGIFGGFAYGAYHESAKVQRIFLEQNKYTMFQHPREAQRAMQDRIALAIFQGGFRTAGRMGLLAFSFSAVAQSLTAVRNYINPLDYGVAGAVMGAIYRIGMGPRGMVGSAVGGCVLGLQGGVLVWGLQKLTGLTVQEKWYMDYMEMQQVKREQDIKLGKKDYRAEVILKDEQVVEDDTSGGVRNLVINIRKFLGEKGLDDVSDIVEDDNVKHSSPQEPPQKSHTVILSESDSTQITTSPSLESLTDNPVE